MFGLLRPGLSPRVPHTCGPALGPLSLSTCAAARRLTLSAGSEISLHQVNCQTAQSLKLNFKAVAPGHRAIPPLTLPTPAKGNSGCPSVGKMDFPDQGGTRMEQLVTVPTGATGQVPSTAQDPAAAGLGETLSCRWFFSQRFPSSCTKGAECAHENLPRTKVT